MLMRYDPFREIDRFTEGLFGNSTRAPWMPMDAVRKGDHVEIHFDLPGVRPDSIDLTVERNVLTVRAERRFTRQEGDEVIASERRQGTFARQLFLGDTLDTERLDARYEDGVLAIAIPVAEAAKPRKVEVTTSGGGPRAIAEAS